MKKSKSFTNNSSEQLPKNKQPTLRLTTLPNDANLNGDIFGGWLMSKIDIAGAVAAVQRANGPVVTVAVSQLQFIKPLFVYDLVSFYAEIIHVGRTSLTVKIEAYAQRARALHETLKVADATYVYVAVSAPGKKRLVPKT
jgi:acyl-CoA thioesterase YciA